MNPSDARDHAVRQWTANPCGAVDGALPDLEYFAKVEQERYKQQPWQHDYFQFAKSAGKDVLEIGVGLGTDLLQFARAGARCHAIDITDAHLALAQQHFTVRGLHVTLKRCDATSIDFPDESFDVVYSFGVLHHIPDANAVVKEIRRVLRPGGVCMLALYHKWSAFHLASKLLRQGLLKGDLIRLGYDGLLATIERGADGIHLKPYVKLYTRRSVRQLLAAMDVLDVSVHQLFASHFSPRILWPLFAPLMPALEPLLGWYVTAIARK